MTSSDRAIEQLTIALAGRDRIERELGAGGMATVYLAEDVKHRRKVALKVLRPELAAVIGAERFLKEIETTANLQHPHILPLHDSGAVDGTAFYVMPFVDGETPRDRLDRENQLPIADAVRIAREIASALDYAHRKGVIHRDIKPENILLHEGQALVADFGIALAAATTGGTRMTETGMSLGTPHYMSPEQAMGERTLDARAECVRVGVRAVRDARGRAAVHRAHRTSHRGARAHGHCRSADRTAQHRAGECERRGTYRVAEAAGGSLRECGRAVGRVAGSRVRLRRDADGDHDALGGHVESRDPRHDGDRGSGAVAAVWAFVQRPAPTAPRTVRVVMALPDSLELGGLNGAGLALSPDGSRFVFFARKAGQQPSSGGVVGLWLRSADQLQATEIAATQSVWHARFAPDGRHIGTVDATRVLKVFNLEGGATRTVADSGVTRDPIAFAPDGSIIASAGRGLVRFPASGGSREPISTIDAKSGEADHRNPDVLPNGKGVIFTVPRTPASNIGLADIAVLDLTSGKHRVLANGVAARYVAGFMLVVHASGVLTAAPFDQDAQQLTGAEVQIASDVRVGPYGEVDLVASGNGMLAYVAGSGANADANLIWLSRDGTVTPIDSQWRANFDALSISPDGRQLAVSIGDAGTEAVWIKQLDGGHTKLPLGGGRNYRPRWLPDGKSALFLSEDVRPFGLMMQRADGVGASQRLASLAQNIAEGFVSADGRWVIMRTSSTTVGRGDIYARRLGDSATIPLVVTKDVEERHPALSPDGKWLAYVSNETGRQEVYVRPFPNVNDGKWLVSLDGGGDPVWSHSGHELFYVSRTDQLWSATISTSPTFLVREQKKLFDLPTGVRATLSTARFDVAPGDQRFLMIRSVAETGGPQRAKVVLVMNVLSELQAKAGGKK